VRVGIPVGISLGKSKATEQKDATEDYRYSFEKLYPYGDYFAVNVSSPNTPGLRELQDKELLMGIAKALSDCRQSESVRKPILVKIAPDLSFEAIDDVLEVARSAQLDGIIATNTTTSREGLSVKTEEAGGLSGAPLRQRSTEIIRYIRRKAPELPIVGVGGVFSAEDAYEKIRAGASLVQIYTGYIYGGPFAAKNINRGLVRLLVRDGFKNIADAIGVDAK
jgi:dihydroorotate dehydrogenase